MVFGVELLINVQFKARQKTMLILRNKKEKRPYFLILLIAINFNAASQNVVVVDSVSKLPLSFVAIKFGTTGFYTSIDGEFRLDSISSDSLEISILGYRNVKLKTITIKDTIFLGNELNELDEVVLSIKPKAVKKVKLSKSPNSFGSWPLQPESEILVSIQPSDEIKDYYLNKVNIQFEKVREKKELKNTGVRAYVRLHLYVLDNNEPSTLIYSSKPIDVNSFDGDEVWFDVTEEQIILEKNGLFVGLELIGYTSDIGEKEHSNSIIRPSLTDRSNDYFLSETYIRYIFKDQAKLTSLNKILEKGMPNKPIDRNLNIGLELSK